MSLLSNVRVLDLADESGVFCGKLLADLGANVIKVEPRKGDATRAIGPFFENASDPHRSLFFWHYNAGKRSIRLDMDDEREGIRWHDLIAGADVLIVTGNPSESVRRGLDYATLSNQNPRLVVGAMSPFGQTGPYADWRSSDLVAQAMGGMAFVNGHPHEPPLRGFGLQAYHSAGLHAAIGVLAALLARERTGRGQLVDVSLQEAVAATVEHVSGTYHLDGTIAERRGSLHWTRAFRVGRCRDGYVLQTTLGDWLALVEWVKADGLSNDLDDPKWESFATRQREHQHIFDVLDTWISTHAADELIEAAQLRRIPYAAVRPLVALVDDPQLRARGFFSRVRHEESGVTVEHPGAPFVLSAGENTEHRAQNTDEPRSTRSEPDLCSESAAVCVLTAQRSLSDENPEPRTQNPDEPRSTRSEASLCSESAAVCDLRAQRSLSGIRVLDFTWVVAGPVATRVLADHGADVIKIERRDATDFGSRRGGLTGNLNRGKRSIVINMADPRGVGLARDLVRCCDVVIDNFSSRVMRNWELDYDHLRALKPSIIAVSMSGFGHTGPHANHVSYGPTLQALAGFSLHMRHDSGEPAGWGYSYADMVGGYSGALAVMSALWHRTRTGQGQYIDLSQYEALAALIGVPLLELLANGEMTAPCGNRSMERPAAPHGIYRCRDRDDDGEVRDRWCAIAVFGDDDWQRFVAALGAPAWTAAPRFATAQSRRRHQDELDVQVEGWTRTRAAEDVMTMLQGAGVAAGVVANGRDLCARDPQLAARGYWTTLATPEGESITVDGPSIKLSATPGRVETVAPLLGEHTDDILRRVLGIPESVIQELRHERVVA